MKKLKESLSRDISMVILFGFFLAVCLLMIVSFGTSMFNGTTLASMGFQLSEVAVLAFGMALCMLLGGIDFGYRKSFQPCDGYGSDRTVL